LGWQACGQHDNEGRERGGGLEEAMHLLLNTQNSLKMQGRYRSGTKTP
jgi:hypothetical protein